MSVRLNIILDEDTYRRLKRQAAPKRLSAFINAAVRARLRPDARTLDAAYTAARQERERAALAEDWAATETEGWPR
jgi:hypothetical protein